LHRFPDWWRTDRRCWKEITCVWVEVWASTTMWKRLVTASTRVMSTRFMPAKSVSDSARRKSCFSCLICLKLVSVWFSWRILTWKNLDWIPSVIDLCPMWAWEHCRIGPPCFLAECRRRRLNQGSVAVFCVVWFVLVVFSLCIFL